MFGVMPPGTCSPKCRPYCVHLRPNAGTGVDGSGVAEGKFAAAAVDAAS